MKPVWSRSIKEVHAENKRLRTENERLRDAIKTHRDQKADDRCIEDDDRLYAALGDGIKCDRRVGSKEAMLANCQRFIERRCEGGGWPTYAELEAENARLRSWEESARQFARNQEFFQGLVTQIGEMFGQTARVSDDGSVQDSVLALKVPELVKESLAENARLRVELEGLKQDARAKDALIEELAEALLAICRTEWPGGSEHVRAIEAGSVVLAKLPKKGA